MNNERRSSTKSAEAQKIVPHNPIGPSPDLETMRKTVGKLMMQNALNHSIDPEQDHQTRRNIGKLLMQNLEAATWETSCNTDIIVLSNSLHLFPHPLSLLVNQRSGGTGVISFQVILKLRICPREIAVLESARLRFSIQISPSIRLHLHRLINLSSAVRTVHDLGYTVHVFLAVLLETVGVTNTCVAHVSTTSSGG